ncbi:MAG: rhomboid family intramembrane serine protease [Gammaproteobacteria bacterium]|nr:rhomboid family intramembrane serine protease [Gammaproteobacteria bacterium]
MIRAIELRPDTETESFIDAIRRSGPPIRAFEEGGKVIVEVADARHAELLRRLHAAWVKGERDWISRLPVQQTTPASGVPKELARYPAVLLLLVTAIALFLFLGDIGRGDINALAASLLIVNVKQGFEVSLERLTTDQEFWRWLTPAFVHFSWMHLVFNCAAVYEFGRRVEMVMGSAAVVLLVTLIAVLANLTQVAFGVSPLFGGLSGVAYGLVGFVLTRARLDPATGPWQLHPAIPGYMLIVLVAFSTGVTEGFGLHIANAAHWGGLVSGMVLAVLAGRPRTMTR